MDDKPILDGLDPACQLSDQVGDLLDMLAAEPDSVSRLAISREAVEVGRKAKELSPPSDPHRAVHMHSLVRALIAEYRETEEPGVLDEAIALSNEVVAIAADGRVAAMAYRTLGRAFRLRYLRNSELAALADAVAAFRSAEEVAEPDEPNRDTMQMDRCLAQVELLQHTPDDSRLYVDTVIVTLAFVPRIPLDKPIGFTLVSMLAEIGQRHLQDVDNQDLAKWVAGAAREAVRRAQVLLTQFPERACALGQLGIILLLAGVVGRDAELLAEGVRAAGVGAAAAPPGHEHHRRHLAQYVLALQMRGRLVPESAAIDEWVEQARGLVATGDQEPDADDLAMLAEGLRMRYHRATDPNDLPEWVDVSRRALAATEPRNRERAERLEDLHHALQHACDPERNGGREPDDGQVRELATVSRDLVAVTPREHEQYLHHARYAARLLAHWASRSSDVMALHEAIELQADVVEALAEDDPDGADAAGLLSHMIEMRAQFEPTSASANSLPLHDRVVEARRAAAIACPSTGFSYLIRLKLWAEALLAHPRSRSDPELVDQTLDAGRRLLAALPLDHPTRVHVMANLVVALRIRFSETGEPDVLHEAETIARQTLVAARENAEDDPDHAFFLSNLSIVLRRRYELDDAPATLNEAIDLARAAVDASSMNHDDSAEQCLGCRLAALAGLLADRYTLTHDQADLDEALAIGRRATEATPRDHHEWTTRIANLGSRLAHNASDDRLQLEEGIQLLSSAVAETPSGHPFRVSQLIKLGRALEIPHNDGRDGARLAAALDTYREAAADELALASDRLRAARAWGAAAARTGDWRQAAEAYRNAVELLHHVAGQELRQADQQRRLRAQFGLASTAAACALQADKRDAAVEILEHGRGILLSRALDSRADLAAVRELAPEWGSRMEQLREELDGWNPAAHGGSGHGIPVEAVVARRRACTNELSDLITRIQKLPGLEGFQQSPHVDDLLACAGEGPVVIVNVAQTRSDALCLTATDGLQVIPLPDAGPEAIIDQASAFLRALAAMRGGAAVDDELRAVLRWLWDAIAGPILTGLGITGRPATDWPRMWWVPTGALALLPLHAAGYHEERHDTNPRTVLDRAVSSYTPTVRVLRNLRARAPRATRPERALLVTMPASAGAAALPGTAREVEIVMRHYPENRTISGSAATHDTVLGAFADSSWVHLACHAESDATDPAASRLIVDGRPITVAEIFGLRLTDAQFLYLSACSTAATAPALADESIHITSAFLLAGFRDVIGTMWEIRDRAAVRMADTFYRVLDPAGPAPRRAAFALHEAVREAREWWPDVATWAAYVHAGT